MRVHFSSSIGRVGLAIGLSGLLGGFVGCSSTNPGESTGGSGGGSSASGGTTSTSSSGKGGSQTGGTDKATGGSGGGGASGGGASGASSGGGQSGGTSGADTTASGGSGGSSGASSSGAGSGGATTDGAVATGDASSGVFKMPKLNLTEFKPPFDPSTVPGIQPLFDGETMTGWNCSPAWSVTDAYIKGNAAASGTFCATKELYSEFRIFVSINQVAGQHAGIGIAGANITGKWGQGDFKFHDLMTPSRYWWDYNINKGDDGGTTKFVDMTAAPYNIPWQGKWYQMEMLVSLAKGTVRAAMNGVDCMTHSFTLRNGPPPSPIGLQAHGGNIDVRYKDIWIEVNPKQTDTLLSVKP
jgi:hypothetical protein